MSDVRLIDANALAKWLDKEHYVDRPAGKCDERQNRVLGIAISALKNPQIAPTIDAVEVVHAYWMDDIYCSNCRAAKARPWAGYLEQNSNTFCHVCGAKMNGGAE